MPKQRSSSPGTTSEQAGFSLLEIIIVIALMAGLYAIGLPAFESITGKVTIDKLNRFTADVRNAYDRAILTKKNHRFVIEHASGKYWLEVTERKDIFVGRGEVERDPSDFETSRAEEEFAAKMTEYEDLAGEIVNDLDDDREIKPSSPLLKAKDRLASPTWSKVDTPEWGNPRSFGTEMIIMDMQSEHHAIKQSFQDEGLDLRSYIYVFPGRIQKAVLHIGFREGENGIDSEREPYTMTIDPEMGIAEYVSGYVEVDVLD